MKRAALLSAAVAAFALVLPCQAEEDGPTEAPYATPSEAPQLSPDYKRITHKVVLITDEALNPRVATLDEGQLVAWISYSAAESVVVFEREVARDMICHSLVNFSLKDDQLRSAPIHAGEFASFCQLKPGRYRYKVVHPAASDPDDPSNQLHGEILVGNASN